MSFTHPFMKWQTSYVRVLAGSKYRLRLIVICGSLLLFIIFLYSVKASFNSCQPSGQAGANRRPCQTSNYKPITLRRKDLNTKSEIGRASNETLGVVTSSRTHCVNLIEANVIISLREYLHLDSRRELTRGMLLFSQVR